VYLVVGGFRVIRVDDCRVVGGLALLAEMEAIDVDKSDKPKTDIVILSTNVFVDPYQELESIETEEAEKAAAEIEAEAQRVAAVKAAAKAAASREALAGSNASTWRVMNSVVVSVGGGIFMQLCFQV
jgi:hypothetical protein